MRLPVRLATAVLLLAPTVGRPADMKDEVKCDGSNPQVLQTMFSSYGYRTKQSVHRESDGFRFWLPTGVAGVTQTGVYSYFALAGDCEVILTYEVLNLPQPRQGYGAGVGLAFDTGDEVGRGSIQRVHRTTEGNGYALQCNLAGARGEMKEENRFVPTTARRGQIGLRRIKKELIFLTSDSPTAPLQEVDRLPFTDKTIGVVRFFADAGGSPTAVDVRVKGIRVRAEVIAGGVPQREESASRWWWLWIAVPAIGLVLLFWRWRRRC